jgi:hypothetical protein
VTFTLGGCTLISTFARSTFTFITLEP